MKKALSIILTLTMVMIMSAGAFAAPSDMPQGADGVVLQKAIDNGLISGYEDGTVRPATPITRAQMAAIIARATGAEDLADLSSFVDVKPGDWYYDTMAKAVSMGAFKGNDKNCLNPNNQISRQEALLVFCRIFDMPKANVHVLNNYPDGADVASWARAEVSRVVAAGYLGDEKDIRPLEPMTRIEFARIMDRLVAAFIDEDGEYTTLPEGNVLVRAKKVSFKGITNDKTIIIGDGAEETSFTDCTCEALIVRGAKTVLNSGAYGRVRAIGNKTELYAMKPLIELVKKYSDGTTGSFSTAPDKGVLVTTTTEGVIE